MRLLYWFLLLCAVVISDISIPKWIVVEDCPSCRFCLALEGYNDPHFCIESVEDMPKHVLASFDFFTLSFSQVETTTLMVETTTASNVDETLPVPLASTFSASLEFLTGLVIGFVATGIIFTMFSVTFYFIFVRVARQLPF